MSQNAPNNNELIAQLALTFAEGIGVKIGRTLLAHFGSASAIFEHKAKELKHVNGLGEVRAKALKDETLLQRAADELVRAQKHNIQLINLGDVNYPQRLKLCDDAPLVLFAKGEIQLNASKTIAIVGTRNNTDYGLRLTEELVDSLKKVDDVLVVSGLAYGIDAIAHKRCVANKIPNIGVVAHGLDKVYPSSHASLARDMMAFGGGLISEYTIGTKPDRNNFPVRNRIVAGLCDVTVIIESKEKGGAMITAYLAADYNREVATFPGRVFDPYSEGPNKLIRKNIASAITNIDDLLELMGWKHNSNKHSAVQQTMFITTTPEEQIVVDVLRGKEMLHADELMLQTKLTNSQLAAVLLQLEMMNVVKSLPGKCYRLR